MPHMHLIKQGKEVFMSIELQLMINVIVSTMPYCILAYCPMLKYLRYKKMAGWDSNYNKRICVCK